MGSGHLGAFDAEALSVKLLGDSIYTNPMMLGYAWQKGRIPLTRESLRPVRWCLGAGRSS